MILHKVRKERKLSTYNDNYNWWRCKITYKLILDNLENGGVMVDLATLIIVINVLLE